MAVCKVKKLELVAHAHCRGEILNTLRRLGSVHISDVSEFMPEAENEAPAFLEKSIDQMESRLSRKRYCLEFVEKYISKPSFTESLLKGKPVFTMQELEDSIANFNTDHFYDQCKEVEKEIADCESQIEKNEILMEAVAYWRDMEYPFESIHDTATTRIRIGLCEMRAHGPMIEEITEASPLFYDMVVDRSRTSVSTLVAYHKSAEDTVAPILRQHGWRAMSFPDLTGTPAEVLDGLQKENAILQERSLRLRERIEKDLVPSRDTLLLLIDHYTQELETLKIQHNFLFTSRAFLITGWVVASREEEMRKRIEETTSIAEIRCSDPGPDDNIPILLENSSITKPFSLLTEVYGRPQYSEFDPTPWFAPFFILFFGICLGDAGYGLVLVIVSFFALKMLEIHGGAKKLLQILFMGGIANIVIGLMTGGIFGIASDELPSFFKGFILFNPTQQVLLFLYIAFALGVIQVLFGIGVKMANNIRQGNTLAAFLDQGLWILFLASLVPVVYKLLFGGQVSATTNMYATNMAKVCAVGLIFTQGRHVRPILASPLAGLAKLYDAMGYFGDVLSYARLMALGLATAFLGMAFNDMAKMTLDIPYGIGYVVAAIILIFSHTFNLIINCLGAFIHSLRLQYLEYFSKFFTGGGQPFKPFAEEREHTVVQSG
jgi:V/A-type H+-transporting ATPase subunit I